MFTLNILRFVSCRIRNVCSARRAGKERGTKLVVQLATNSHEEELWTWVSLNISLHHLREGARTLLNLYYECYKVQLETFNSRVATTQHEELRVLRGYFTIQLVGSNLKCRRGPKLDERLTYNKWRI